MGQGENANVNAGDENGSSPSRSVCGPKDLQFDVDECIHPAECARPPADSNSSHLLVRTRARSSEGNINEQAGDISIANDMMQPTVSSSK